MTETEKCEWLSFKPQCQGILIFNEHIGALNMKTVTRIINHPFLVGFAVFILSKIQMFKYVAILILQYFPAIFLISSVSYSSLYFEFYFGHIFQNDPVRGAEEEIRRYDSTPLQRA